MSGAGSAPYSREKYTLDPAKRCAIVGFASSSRNLAPFADESIEIWGMNSLYALVPRLNRLYEIHPRSHFRKDLNRAELQQIGVDHYEYLKSRPGPGQPGHMPIFMQEAYPEIPASVPWPRNEINAWTQAMFGPEAEVDYFTSTPGQMIVHAIFEGYSEIQLYGIDLLQAEEYAYQRPGAEYWIGIARGLGIKVVVPPSSAILKANYVYGYVEPPVASTAITPLVKFWEAKGEQIDKAQHETVALMNTINGARQVVHAIATRIAAGEDFDKVKAYVALEQDQLGKKFEMAKDGLNKLMGQKELAQSAASWTDHYGRGGLLEGMETPKVLTQEAGSSAATPAGLALVPNPVEVDSMGDKH